MRSIFQHIAPTKRPGDSFNHGVVDVTANGRHREVPAIGGEDELPATAPSYRNRHSHGNRSAVVVELRLGHQAALRASGLIALRSVTSFVRPSVRIRMSAPSR